MGLPLASPEGQSLGEPKLADFGLNASQLERAAFVAKVDSLYSRLIEICFFISGTVAFVAMLVFNIYNHRQIDRARDFIGTLIGGSFVGGLLLGVALMLAIPILYFTIRPLADFGGVRKRRDAYLEACAKVRADLAESLRLKETAKRRAEETERIRRAEEEQLRRVKSKRFAEHWQTLRGYPLEEALETLFRSVGYEVSRSGGRGDEGVDLRLTKGLETVIVQSKGWAKPIGPAVVREIIGVRQLNNCSDAWIVSANGATPAARDEARRGRVKIISAEELARMVRNG